MQKEILALMYLYQKPTSHIDKEKNGSGCALRPLREICVDQKIRVQKDKRNAGNGDRHILNSNKGSRIL